MFDYKISRQLVIVSSRWVWMMFDLNMKKNTTVYEINNVNVLQDIAPKIMIDEILW